MAMTAIDVQPR